MSLRRCSQTSKCARSSDGPSELLPPLSLLHWLPRHLHLLLPLPSLHPKCPHSCEHLCSRLCRNSLHHPPTLRTTHKQVLPDNCSHSPSHDFLYSQFRDLNQAAIWELHSWYTISPLWWVSEHSWGERFFLLWRVSLSWSSQWEELQFLLLQGRYQATAHSQGYSWADWKQIHFLSIVPRTQTEGWCLHVRTIRNAVKRIGMQWVVSWVQHAHAPWLTRRCWS